MKNFIIASLMLTSAFAAHAANVTILSTTLPATRGYTTVDTRFYIDTDMKEAYAEFKVEEQETFYVRDCSYRGGYGPGYPYPGGYRGPGYPYPHPYPAPYCRDIPQTRYNTVLTDKVKIEGITMNGDDVIYQGNNGDVVCGTMGKSRVFRVPTFYLSGKCNLDGKVTIQNGQKVLVVKFITK